MSFIVPFHQSIHIICDSMRPIRGIGLNSPVFDKYRAVCELIICRFISDFSEQKLENWWPFSIYRGGSRVPKIVSCGQSRICVHSEEFSFLINIQYICSIISITIIIIQRSMRLVVVQVAMERLVRHRPRWLAETLAVQARLVSFPHIDINLSWKVSVQWFIVRFVSPHQEITLVVAQALELECTVITIHRLLIMVVLAAVQVTLRHNI